MGLWGPLAAMPFKAQKVEIVLDVSHRMGEQFDLPGTTKLDAARTGVLQVLGYLENQNIAVALRLVNSSSDGQCVIEPATSLAVDFTRDLDKIRNFLGTIQPASSDKVPVVNAIDFSIDHYLESRMFDKKYYIYSFIGGDDTCGEKLGVYLSSPKVVNNAVTSELFLIVLLDPDQERTFPNLPNAKLDYARSVAQVQEIVDSNNQLIEVATPTPTVTPSTSPTASGVSPSLAGSTMVVEPAGVSNNDQPAESVAVPPVADAATVGPSATLLLPPTSAPTQFPSSTFTNIPTRTPSYTPEPPPTLTELPPPYVVLTGFEYMGSGEGCSAMIYFDVQGSPATGIFRVTNNFYRSQSPPYDAGYPSVTLPVGTNGYPVGLGGSGDPINYNHEVWFEYESGESNHLAPLICPGLTAP